MKVVHGQKLERSRVTETNQIAPEGSEKPRQGHAKVRQKLSHVMIRISQISPIDHPSLRRSLGDVRIAWQCWRDTHATLLKISLDLACSGVPKSAIEAMARFICHSGMPMDSVVPAFRGRPFLSARGTVRNNRTMWASESDSHCSLRTQSPESVCGC